MLKNEYVRSLIIELLHQIDRLDDSQKISHIDEIIEALVQRKMKINMSKEE